MLSCVLSEPLTTSYSLIVSDEDHKNHPSQTQRKVSTWFDPKRGTSNAYFPSLEVARNLLRPPPSKSSRTEQRASGPQSTSSSAGATLSDPMTPFSTGATPPNHHRPFISFEKDDTQAPAISTSPEYTRSTYRSNSNLASTFAASFSRPFSFSASVSSSPPTTQGRKRLSPADSYVGAPPTGVSWGATSFFSKPSAIIEGPKSVYALSGSDNEEDIAVPKPPVFTTRLKNQDQFDNEAYASVSLLDPDQSWRYHAYREIYAHMLLVWDMPLARCDVLKHQRPQSVPGFSSKSATGFPSLLIAIGKSNSGFSNSIEGADSGLAFMTHSTSRTSESPQQHNDQRRTKYASSGSAMICIMCAEIIRGLSSPCLACGHVLHTSCRSAVLSQNFIASEAGECVSGCGCRCVDHLIAEVEVPLRSKISPSITIMEDLSTEQEENRWQQQAGKDEDAWEDVSRADVAYKSLARVRERYITPKPSQIWRGGEDRKDPRLAIKREKSY